MALLHTLESTLLDDATPIDEACALVCRKLGGTAEIEASMKQFAVTLLAKPHYAYEIGVVRAKGFTAKQIDDMLDECGMEGGRSTVERVWGIEFKDPEVPALSNAKVSVNQSHLRESRFMEAGDKTLGAYLDDLGVLDNLVLSPRLPSLIVNPKNVCKPTFYKAVREQLLWTFKTYSISNLDMEYCNRTEELYTKDYATPDGCSFAKSLKQLANNKNKTGATTLGTLPLVDLSPKAIAHVREKQYPVEFDEHAPSVYSQYFASSAATPEPPAASFEELEPSQAQPRNQPMALASAAALAQHEGAKQPRATPGALAAPVRKALGSVPSATTGFRHLPPKPPSNFTPGSQPEGLTQENPEGRNGEPAKPTAPATASEKRKQQAVTMSGASADAPAPKRRRRPKSVAAAAEMTNDKPSGMQATTATSNPDQEATTEPGSEPSNDVEAGQDASSAAADATGADKSEPEVPPFAADGCTVLEYSADLVKVGQMVASYTHGTWQLGRISSLTYLKQKWIEYLHLPKVKSHKKADKGKLIYQELNHEFNKDEYSKTWAFIEEEWEKFLDMP